MSEPESTDRFLPEEAAQSFDEVVQMSVPVSSIARHSRNNGNSHLTILPAPTAATLQTPRSNQEQHTSPDKDELRQDLAKIIARAREEISRLRQELTRLEAETARIAQERDSA